MVVVLQRVREAEVTVDGRVVGAIGAGLLLLVGVLADDKEEDAYLLADKIAGLRVFNDSSGKMNLSVQEVGGSILVVSQFTLCGDLRKGRRPNYIDAGEPSHAQELIAEFAERLAGHGLPVERGEFGAMMDVALVNEGPVTFVLDSRAL